MRHEVCNDRSLRGCKGDFIVSRAADEKTLIDVLSKSLTVCSVVPSFDASRFSGVFVRLYFSVSLPRCVDQTYIWKIVARQMHVVQYLGVGTIMSTIF